jgi:hypothetical protein
MVPGPAQLMEKNTLPMKTIAQSENKLSVDFFISGLPFYNE